jgi:16S rRNA (guanine527-N7)-methyltransferase
MNPTSDEARRIIRDQLGLSLSQYKQLAALAVLVVDWNEKINLVSRKDCTPDVVFGRHILPSLAACKAGVIQDKTHIVDVGTGGGFPGLPLAIAYPDCEFLLVDSVGKKLTAVQDMADQLGLENVQTHHGRAELLQSQKYDVCVGRSVAAIPTYCFWIQKLLKKGSGKLLYMIGGDIEETILRQAEMDQTIDDLMECPGASDKRVLIFPQAAVASIANASGEKIRVQDLSIAGKRKSNNKVKPAKGEWKKRDHTAPKPRGYENFKRFDSMNPEA